MDKPVMKVRDNPEAKIREKIKNKLMSFGWHVFVTHGNKYQHGFPDLYAIHKTHGARWIEVKNPAAYEFTAAQLQNFPLFTACNIGVWVLVSDEQSEIDRLFKPANWWTYLKIMK